MSRLVAHLAAPVTHEDHAQGRQDAAAVTLLQHGDYECPYTRLSRHSINALQREFPDTVRFVFRHFPMAEIHPHARAAAFAAEAAGRQGDLWTMHEYLFEHQRALRDADLHQYATDLKLEPVRFERDRTSPEVVRRIDRYRASGKRSGIMGTPTFYVNGVRHDGSFDVDSLRAAVATVMERPPA